MSLKVIKTKDGSNSVFISELNETYHSTFGALQESIHVYIKNGFDLFSLNSIGILEVGLGTGLNAALTWQKAESSSLVTNYISLEPFPLSLPIMKELSQSYDSDLAQKLLKIHEAPWNLPISFSPCFTMIKYMQSIQDFSTNKLFDLIYMDAFVPDKQPEMWTMEVISKLANFLHPNGAITTYCAKGELKRNLKTCGLFVNSLPGPIGKREIIVARKMS